MIPEGAIVTTDELQSLAGKEVWRASPTHCTTLGSPILLTGNVGVTKYPDKHEYHWFEYRYSRIDHTKNISSLLDMNIPANGYNDWYLFHSEQAARAWIDTKP